MNPELLLAYFNRISEAPDAVPRLRTFVLKLAVQGKLVKQDPHDESASELLQRIHAWRKKAESAKDIRAPRKPLQAVGETEPPYSLPNGWKWARLGELIYIHSGDGLTVEAMRNGSIPVFGGNGIAGYHDTPNIFQPSIVIGRVGYYCGSIHVTPTQAWVTDNAFVTEFPVDEIFQSFLVLLLRATNLKENERATAQPVISGSKVYPIVVGLPPLAEQHRIVAKVDELMAQCDRLETAKVERENRRDRLAAASHHHLNNGANAEAFRVHANFFLSHLPRLTIRPDQTKQLRQTILNLAIRGHLVPQDTKDEPASQLLNRIVAQKAQLVATGVIRASKPLPVVDSGDLFQLPTGWEWTRWEAIALKIGDIDHKMPETVADGVPFVSPRDFLPNNRIDFDGAKRISLNDFIRLSSKMKATVGDLIYPRYGTIGENRLVTEERDFLVSYSCAVIKVLRGFVDAQYQYLYSLSSFCRAQASAAENKTTQANVGIKSIQEFIVPLPPLSEQRRIVDKVDELMGICDRLEAQLATTQTETGRLLESVLHHALHSNAQLLKAATQ